MRSEVNYTHQVSFTELCICGAIFWSPILLPQNLLAHSSLYIASLTNDRPNAYIWIQISVLLEIVISFMIYYNDL